MWGTQGWNQWALQPAMFNDVPHEQIDWAELAKQWIQMQQNQPPDVPPAPPPSAIPPPPGHMPLVTEDFPESNVTAPLLKTPLPSGGMPEPFHAERPFENDQGAFLPKVGDNTYWSKSQWEASAAGDIDERLWPGPAIEPAPPILPGKETFDYGHVHENPPLAMQSIDYNHMSDYSYNQVYAPPENQYDQYWSQVNAAPTISPMFLKKERIGTNLQVEEDTTQIDAAKRKQLPAWIRDGLEKMEQERLKRLERERAVKESAEKIAKLKSAKKLLDDSREESGVTVPSRSKFESDSDMDGEDENEMMEKRSPPVEQRIPSPVEDTRTEEEKKQEMMLKVRRMLTEVLLSVTNAEMFSIAQEVYRKAVSKAPARQLASSTSLSSVASGLRGLASYGTESEASEVDEENEASDSEEEIYRRIKEQKKLFAVKERKIIADIERRELQEHAEAEKIKYENSGKIMNKEFLAVEKPESIFSDLNTGDKNTSSEAPFQQLEQDSVVSSNETPFIKESSSEENSSHLKDTRDDFVADEPEKQIENEESNSSHASSSSSDSGSESDEKLQRKSEKDRKTSHETKRISKKEKSPRRDSRHKRSRSRDSDSSDKHKMNRSYDKSDKKSSSYKKRKKYKRSTSSSSSSSTSRKKKHSSKYDSNHNHSRERRSQSYDRHQKHSISSSKSYHKSDSSHAYRSSHSHRYEDRDKYERRYKEEKRHRESKRSPSPYSYSHSSKLPRKYRSSRSLSSESESSGKKSKKSRNH